MKVNIIKAEGSEQKKLLWSFYSNDQLRPCFRTTELVHIQKSHMESDSKALELMV